MLLACCSLLEVPQTRLVITAAGTIASLFGGSHSMALQLADFSTCWLQHVHLLRHESVC